MILPIGICTIFLVTTEYWLFGEHNTIQYSERASSFFTAHSTCHNRPFNVRRQRVRAS